MERKDGHVTPVLLIKLESETLKKNVEKGVGGKVWEFTFLWEQALTDD